MKTKEEIEKQLEKAYEHLERISQATSIGKGEWRAKKRYINALEWVLDQDSEGQTT